MLMTSFPSSFIASFRSFIFLDSDETFERKREREERKGEGEGREGQQDLVETRRTNEMDKKAGGEADPEAMGLHIINSCLFALDPSPFCTS